MSIKTVKNQLPVNIKNSQENLPKKESESLSDINELQKELKDKNKKIF